MNQAEKLTGGSYQAKRDEQTGRFSRNRNWRYFILAFLIYSEITGALQQETALICLDSDCLRSVRF